MTIQSENSIVSFVVWAIGAVIVLGVMQLFDLPASVSVFVYVVLGFFALWAVAGLIDFLREWINTRRLARLVHYARQASPEAIEAARALVKRMSKGSDLPYDREFLGILHQEGPLQADLLRLACHRASRVHSEFRDAFERELEHFAEEDLPRLSEWLRNHWAINETGSTPLPVLYARIVARASPASRKNMVHTFLKAAPPAPKEEWTALFRAVKAELRGLSEEHLGSYLREKRDRYVRLL